MKDILILSDLHVGSLWGLWPPDFEADDPRGDNRLKFVQIVIPELEAIPDVERRRAWTEWEEGVLRKYYSKKPAEAIAKAINRSVSAVHNHARMLGVKAVEEDE